MKITLLGNCQTRALACYLHELNANFDVKWLCIEKFQKAGGEWVKNKFRGKFIDTIPYTSEGIKRLNISDYVIFQHIDAKTSENYNFAKIKMHASNAKLISISSMLYKPNDPTQRFLKGMIERAEKFNIDIPAHKMIEKHGSKIKMLKKHHPNAFYFMELVREICKKTGWNFFSKKQYDQYLEEGYPFG